RGPRGHERKPQLLQRVATPLVVGLARVDQGNERPRVSEGHLRRRRDASRSANASPVRRACPPPERTAPITSPSSSLGRCASVRRARSAAARRRNSETDEPSWAAARCTSSSSSGSSRTLRTSALYYKSGSL